MGFSTQTSQIAQQTNNKHSYKDGIAYTLDPLPEPVREYPRNISVNNVSSGADQDI